MIRTGEEYRNSIRDDREVWIDGARVADVTTHPAFKPVVDARARINDMAHEESYRDTMSYEDPETGDPLDAACIDWLKRAGWMGALAIFS